MPCARMEPLSITTEMESAVVSTVIARRTTGEYVLASDDTTYLRTGCAVAHPITDSAHIKKLPPRVERADTDREPYSDGMLEITSL